MKGGESLENVCGSRLANQSSRKESLPKSNGFASKPTESHSFPSLLMLNIASFFSLSFNTSHICNIRLPSLENATLAKPKHVTITIIGYPFSLYFKPF